MMDIIAAIIDIDMTLVDSSMAEASRKQRDWPLVYSMIPNFKLHPQMVPMISGLLSRGIKLAIVSSSPRPYCERILKHFNIPYDVLVAYHDTQLHKPDPQPFCKALSLIGVDPSKSMSLGDDVKDILAAKSTGIKINIGCAWHTDNTKELQGSGTDFVASSPNDVITILSRLK